MAGLTRAVLDGAEPVLNALFPPRCGACDVPLAVRPEAGLCHVCDEILEPNISPSCCRCDLPGPTFNSHGSTCPTCAAVPPPFDAMRAPWLYGGPLAELIVRAKFRRREDLASALGTLLCRDQRVGELLQGTACLVPIPLGPKRQRQRGYNQSALIARVVAHHVGLPVAHCLLRRRNTAEQSELPLSARAGNVAGAFVCRGRAVPDSVAVVDDVVTSTETVRQAALAMRRAGARRVVVLAVARAEAPRPTK